MGRLCYPTQHPGSPDTYLDYHRLQNWLRALAQCRGTNYLGARKLSRYTGFYLRADARFDSRSFSEGWCPGARIITNLSWVQE